MNKAIFLDRDGVINIDVELLRKIEDIKIIDKVPEALRILKERDFYLLCISNQTVVARGLITEKGVNNINEEINRRIIADCRIGIDGFYVCPHHPNADIKAYRKVCECRKPCHGMILQAAKDFDIDLSQSYMIGDRTSDIAAGKNAGCKTILIKYDYSYRKLIGKDYDENINPDFIVNSLYDATKIIM